MGGEQPGEADDLLEAQQRLARQKAVVGVEHRLGHAIHAAEVAAVGDRDAQILHRAAAAVHQPAGGGRQRGGDRRQLAQLTLVGEGNDFLVHVPGRLKRERFYTPAGRGCACRGIRPGAGGSRQQIRLEEVVGGPACAVPRIISPALQEGHESFEGRRARRRQTASGVNETGSEARLQTAPPGRPAACPASRGSRRA